jgi:hypothetical protein
VSSVAAADLSWPAWLTCHLPLCGGRQGEEWSSRSIAGPDSLLSTPGEGEERWRGGGVGWGGVE